MPWTPEQYRSRHNKKLSLSEAGHAARIATAMIKRGVPEGEAIATANARVQGSPRGLSKLIRKAKGTKP